MLTKIPNFYYSCVFSYPSIYNTSVQELGKPIISRQFVCIRKHKDSPNRNFLCMEHHSLHDFV